mgnify:CR=1 FL=1
MFSYLGFLIFSFVINSLAIVPFINALYSLKMKRLIQTTTAPTGDKTPIFDSFHNWKVGTPVGGGLLTIVTVSGLFAILLTSLSRLGVHISSAHEIGWEIGLIFFTFISFGVLGLYDDIKKVLVIKKDQFFGLRMIHKLVIQLILGLIVGWILYGKLGIDILHISSTNIVLHLGIFFVPIAAIVVVGFANAFNLTDGLDGLSSGLLIICLFVFWTISHSTFDTVLSLFISLWIGALIAFLYFNIYPARIWLGDVGALSFGATLAVVALLLGKILVLFIIGGLFIVEAASSVIQLISKRFYGKKVFPAAPIHLTLQKHGWEEPKIVMRAWLAGLMLGILGLWMATL